MAGIGFALRRMARQDVLSANLGGYGHAVLAAAGPWLFTIVALAVVDFMVAPSADRGARERFAVVLTYNFSFSMLAAGPIVMVVSRALANAIYAKDVGNAVGLLLGGLLLLYGLLAVTGVPYYLLATDLPLPAKLVAILCLFVIGSIWLVASFMSALKSYLTVSLAFAVGTGVAVVLASALGSRHGETGLTASFTIGLAITLFVLCGCVFVEFPGACVKPAALLSAMREYADLALVGLFYNAALWADKWIMWLAPGHLVTAGSMQTHPGYDGAMFLAALTIIPSMVLTLVAVETRFHERCMRFFGDIERHATIQQIRANHRKLMSVAVTDFRDVAVLQLVVCYLAIVVAPGLISLAKGGAEMVPIFRLGALGALFHSMLLLVLTLAAYLDLRRLLLRVSALFLVLNAGLTAFCIYLGPAYHGYGYMLATLLTLLVALSAAVGSARRLVYLTFIGNNASVRNKPKRRR